MADKDFVVKNGLVVNTNLVYAMSGKIGINTSSVPVTLTVASNDAIKIPVGTTAQRPTGANGYFRYNGETNVFEGFQAGAWSSFGGVSSVSPTFTGTSTFTGNVTISVGLGLNTTNTTFALLYANGGIRARGGAVTEGSYGYSFNTEGDADGGMFSPSDGNIVFKANNVETIRLTAGSVTVNGSVQSANVVVDAKTDNYTLSATDSGHIIAVSNTVLKSVTVPAGLPVGFRCMVYMDNTGNVVIANAASVSLFSRTNAFTCSTRYGSMSVFVYASNQVIVDGAI